MGSVSIQGIEFESADEDGISEISHGHRKKHFLRSRSGGGEAHAQLRILQILHENTPNF